MPSLCFFFFNDTATTEIYTLSLHDALPISTDHRHRLGTVGLLAAELSGGGHGPQAEHGEHGDDDDSAARSEEHTSELQSQSNLVCRLLLEKKKQHDQRLDR